MTKTKLYEGPVVFVDGVHYPVGKDDHADTSRPLRWTPDGYRDAEPGEPLHNDVHHVQFSDPPPGSED